MQARSEQGNQIDCFGIISRGVGPFGCVATGTRKASIFHAMLAMVLLGPNMVNAVRQDAVILRKATIFAKALRPLPDLFALEFRHGLTGEAGFLKGKTGLGVEKVDEFADAKKPFQRNLVLGRYGAAVVFVQQLSYAFRGVLIELEFKKGAGSARVQATLGRRNDMLQDICIRNCC